MKNQDYTRVNYPEPHLQRMREILVKYPQVKKLFGHNPWTAVYTVVCVALQLTLAYLLKDQSWWVIALAVLFVGAFIQHALFVVFHECAHNLVFGKALWDKCLSIFANLPGLFPSAIGFRNFHLIHHRYQGQLGWDTDLAGPNEAAWIGNSTIKKALWFLIYFYIAGPVRLARVKKVFIFEKWSIINVVANAAVTFTIWYFWGWGAIAYLFFSMVFSVGLHPVGGRWISEHYIMKEGQETYSYYGPINYFALNVGYHNEHHDFMMVPWNNLSKLKAIAAEYYDTLYSHTSWGKLMWNFVTKKEFSFYRRYVRPDHDDVKRYRRNFTTSDTEKITSESIREVQGEGKSSYEYQT